MDVRVDQARQERGRTKVGHSASRELVELAWRADPCDPATRNLDDDRTAELPGNGIEPVRRAQERIGWLRVRKKRRKRRGDTDRESEPQEEAWIHGSSIADLYSG